jgi:hypothetical protein
MDTSKAPVQLMRMIIERTQIGHSLDTCRRAARSTMADLLADSIAMIYRRVDFGKWC